MFVDFDNVFTGLMALDQAAAKRFAEDPNHWTEELADGGADADFTSLVQRFRAADRMTTVIASGAVAFAYREMADGVVESHDFVAILNGTAAEIHAVATAQPQRAEGTAKTKSKATTPSGAAIEVCDFVRTAPGPVVGASGPPHTHGRSFAEDRLGRLWEVR